MRVPTLALVLTLSLTLPALPATATAAPAEATVYDLLRGISDAARDAAARAKLGAYLRQVIQSELAAPAPAFCPAGGHGHVDATALRDYALSQAPTQAQQRSRKAGPVVLGYLAATYPCGEARSVLGRADHPLHLLDGAGEMRQQ